MRILDYVIDNVLIICAFEVLAITIPSMDKNIFYFF